MKAVIDLPNDVWLVRDKLILDERTAFLPLEQSKWEIFWVMVMERMRISSALDPFNSR